jgi:hypothetical protein
VWYPAQTATGMRRKRAYEPRSLAQIYYRPRKERSELNGLLDPRVMGDVLETSGTAIRYCVRENFIGTTGMAGAVVS